MASKIPTTVLPCGLNVSKQGLGLMGMSAFYSSANTVTEDQAIKVFTHAVNSGVTLFNTADFYGPLNKTGYGHNLRLLSKCLKAPGIDRNKLQIMMKIGIDTRQGTFKHNASPKDLKTTVDWALKELGGLDMIDVLVLNREDPAVPLEDSVDALYDIVKEGKARYIGLSEFSAGNIRRAAARAPIACVEMEWSLMSRDIESSVVPTCRELGVGIVAYAPLSRGMLSGTMNGIPADYRGTSPRFKKENFAHNMALVDALKVVADRKGCTPGQVALAWVHAQGSDVVPIPGTTSLENLSSNLKAAFIELTADDLAAIQAAFPADAVKGDRYSHMAMTYHGNKVQ